MVAVYDYQNFRLFIAEAMEEKRKQSKAFSLRAFASKSGFSSHTFLPKVISGSRNLASDSARKVGIALGLKGSDLRYFETLVDYNQCLDEDERSRLYRELMGIYAARNKQPLDDRHSQYYDFWYFPVVRHLAAYAPWKNNYAKLAEMVAPPITEEQAKDAVNCLVELGLLRKDDEGSWSVNSNTINVDKIPLVARTKGRRDILLRGLDAQERFSAQERFTYCALLSMNESSKENVITLLRDAGKKSIEEASQDQGVNRVYQAVLQLFPVSQKWGKSM